MTCIIEPSGTYYETLTELSAEEIADLPLGSIIAPQRPDYFYKWNSASSDWDYDIDAHVEGETEASRKQRDWLLVELDQLVSNPLRFASYTDQQKVDLADYCQALLEVPQQSGFPLNIVWPVKP